MKREPVRVTPDGIEVDLLVVPNARSDSVVGLHGDRIKVRVASPPESGRANGAVEDLVCMVAGVRRVEVVRGRTSRAKTVLLRGVASEEIEKIKSLLT